MMARPPAPPPDPDIPGGDDGSGRPDVHGDDVLDAVRRLAAAYGLTVVRDDSVPREHGALWDTDMRVVLLNGRISRVEQEIALERALADYRWQTATVAIDLGGRQVRQSLN